MTRNKGRKSFQGKVKALGQPDRRSMNLTCHDF